MDPMDHDAYSGFNDDHEKPRASGETKVADVVPIPGEKSMGSGQDSRAADYATGKNKDPKVLPIGMPTLKAWAGRQNG